MGRCHSPRVFTLACLVAVAATTHADETVSVHDGALSYITVRASRVANEHPAGSYATLATALRFDPLIELQSRGLPEGQADVSVRGGLFENTGFKVGAVTVMDPQTGHYGAALPIDPALLSDPALLTGVDNALGGFNSSVATIHYAIPAIVERGAVQVGAGSDRLRFQSLRFAGVRDGRNGDEWGLALSLASASGDGSLGHGDHEFARYNLQLQRATDDAQTDLIVAYQDRFYGWPGAYTGFASLPETDHTKTTFLLANHRIEEVDGWLEFGAYHRRLEDDYDFDRRTEEADGPGAFAHETVVSAIGFRGLHRGEYLDWRFGGQLTADELVRSTDLTEGEFDERRYFKLGVVPSLTVAQSLDHVLTLRFGATLDTSNRDSELISPLIGVTWQTVNGEHRDYLDFEIAETSQVPGYTALKSPPAGLFGGNSALGRERARQVAVSLGREAPDWSAHVTLFHRADENLVDWTYAQGAPFARQANAVDAKVIGVEALIRRDWSDLGVSAGYTYLNKDADYASAAVDASFYALNYARHRATLATVYRWGDRITWRLDGEYRVQQANPLRTSGDHALRLSLSLAWEAAGDEGLGFALTADNLTDEDFQPFPGTPAVGRQVSLSVRYGW